MTHGLRRLERLLVRERYRIGVPPVIDRFLFTWQRALDRDRSPPDPLDLGHALLSSGFYVLTVPRAIEYLDTCRRAGSLPDGERLLRILLPPSPHPPFPDRHGDGR